jgi:hypothetical protein
MLGGRNAVWINEVLPHSGLAAQIGQQSSHVSAARRCNVADSFFRLSAGDLCVALQRACGASDD